MKPVKPTDSKIRRKLLYYLPVYPSNSAGVSIRKLAAKKKKWREQEAFLTRTSLGEMIK